MQINMLSAPVPILHFSSQPSKLISVSLPDGVAFSGKHAQKWTQAIVICGLSKQVFGIQWLCLPAGFCTSTAARSCGVPTFQICQLAAQRPDSLEPPQISARKSWNSFSPQADSWARACVVTPC